MGTLRTQGFSEMLRIFASMTACPLRNFTDVSPIPGKRSLTQARARPYIQLRRSATCRDRFDAYGLGTSLSQPEQQDGALAQNRKLIMKLADRRSGVLIILASMAVIIACSVLLPDNLAQFALDLMSWCLVGALAVLALLASVKALQDMLDS